MLVDCNECGDIVVLQLEGGEILLVDFFVDCIGFVGLLIDKMFKMLYVFYVDVLFNDVVVVLFMLLYGLIMLQMIFIVFDYGWVWKILFIQCYGNGYVYSIVFCMLEQVEIELCVCLGLFDVDVLVCYLCMCIGWVEWYWYGNCLVVGLVQGFIELFEVMVLMLVQCIVSLFVDVLEKGDLGIEVQVIFNVVVNVQFDGMCDYIVVYYKINICIDIDYWCVNVVNMQLFELFIWLFKIWLVWWLIIGGIQQGVFGQGYLVMFWYSLFVGMGLFLEQVFVFMFGVQMLLYSVVVIENLIECSVLNFFDYCSLLQNILLVWWEELLQVYFW